MTEHEELKYLVDLCVAAGQWQRGEGDPDGLTLEIRDRIDKLLRVPTDRLVGPGDPDGTNPKVVKIRIDGKFKRVPVSECHQEPYASSPTGYRWVWDGGAAEYDKKAKQIDKMWTDHDQLKDAVYDE